MLLPSERDPEQVGQTIDHAEPEVMARVPILRARIAQPDHEFHVGTLEEVFRARVRIHYGHIESCAFFSNCEKSTLYHDQMEYGYTEFRKRDGTPAEEGESGEIIATGFDNRTMPLIRFRTRDWAERGVGKCDCGRNYPLVKRIEGRDIVRDAGPGLVHDLHVTPLQDDETQPLSVRYLGRLLELQSPDPEIQGGGDVVHGDNGGESLHR